MELEKYLDSDLLAKFEFHNYGHALEILHESFPEEWTELQDCLRRLHLTRDDIRKAGGNESPIPKNLMIFYIRMGGEKYVFPAILS